MVRVAIIVLTLTHSFADEDVYHHTQLLQTKVSPQKVPIDAGGEKDHVTLFQSSFQKKLYQNSRKTAFEKVMAFVEGRRKKGDWSSYDGSSSYGTCEMEEFMADEAKKYYGDDVDLEKFCGCIHIPPDTDSESWYPDPNVGMKTVTEHMDDCMGSTNSLTEKCQSEYGEDVALFDCMMCGMMCECESVDTCDLTCHRECMSFDEEHWADESSYDSTWDSSYDDSSDDHEGGECQLFYGEAVDVEKCEDCGEKCWETALGDIPSDGDSYAKEKAFWDGFGGCMDKCVDMPNLVTKACKDGYGDDVDLFECINCGMVCDCNLEECEGSSSGFDCHHTCMEDNWMVWSDSMTSNSTYSFMKVKDMKAMKAKALANLRKKVKSVQSVKLPKKLEGDATDLMQTSKHLKK